MFDHARMPIGNVPELCEADKTIHIDSKTLDEAESEKGGSKKEAALALRRIVDTVGKTGEPGEQDADRGCQGEGAICDYLAEYRAH